MLRTNECYVCGKDRCSKFSERRGYCFRFGVSWIKNGQGVYLGHQGNLKGYKGALRKLQSEGKIKAVNMEFDFGDAGMAHTVDSGLS